MSKDTYQHRPKFHVAHFNGAFHVKMNAQMAELVAGAICDDGEQINSTFTAMFTFQNVEKLAESLRKSGEQEAITMSSKITSLLSDLAARREATKAA
jgi:hypothetical protein